MAVLGLAGVTGLLLAVITFYRYIVYPAFISPLSKVPNAHPTAAVSPLWILWKRKVDRENVTVYKAHERLGPVVRLGPNELSINCYDGGLKTVYAGGYEKGSYYDIFDNYNSRVMFSMPGHAAHSARKRMISSVYAKSTVHASPSFAAQTEKIICHRLLPRLYQAHGQAVEAYELFSAMALDFVTAYGFGLGQGSNYVQDPVAFRKLLTEFKARQGSSYWIQEWPGMVNLLRFFGLDRLLIPTWVGQSFRDTEAWNLGLCDAAEAVVARGSPVSPVDEPTVYSQLRSAMGKQSKSEKSENGASESASRAKMRIELAAEMNDHTFAGLDTTGATMTSLAWELSKPANAHVLKALQEELSHLSHGYRMADEADERVPLPSAKEVDGLPLLHAVIMETLRLHPAIPGGQPRINPANASLGSGEAAVHGIPAGVRVSASAYSLHRNRDAFPDPEVWKPQRWLAANGAIDAGGDKARYFWAFGSGGRMCVGSNLAMTEMKCTVAAIWSNFTTSIVDDAGMEDIDGFLGGPKGTPDGTYLRLRFRPCV